MVSARVTKRYKVQLREAIHIRVGRGLFYNKKGVTRAGPSFPLYSCGSIVLTYGIVSAAGFTLCIEKAREPWRVYIVD